MSNNGDTPAMPVVTEAYEYLESEGLTKREQFSMAAMQGILASKWYGDFTGSSQYDDKPDAAAEMAVKHADALLAELEK